MIKKNRRSTLAVVAVRRGEGLVGVLRRLWEYWLRLRFRLSCLYLDRGFYAVAGLRWLLLGIAVILHNLWVFLKWTVVSWPRRGRGGREVWEKGLPFRRLLFFLAWAIERRLGVEEALFMPIKSA